MPRNTVAEVLECFDNEFADFASAVARGEYLLWLGSGISREVVPGVPELLTRMLDFLQRSCVAADPTCRFRQALDEVLEVAAVPAATLASIDFTSAVGTWPNLDDIVNRLIDHYSEVLDVRVRDEADDFLVWSGLDVASTYGDPNLAPDVEHFCIAILILEGVVRSAATTNWDGLVEAAIDRLECGGDRVLNVRVKADDFTAPSRPAELVKFHGCAVRAARDPAQYRSLLIARKSQISGWTTQPPYRMMKHYLEHLFASRPAFFIGLSAQDANIHTILHEAIQYLARSWPAAPPAVIFAVQRLSHHNKHVLQVTYGDDYSANSEEIQSSALLGAYAKPALLALVLFTLADKLGALIRLITELNLSDPDFARIHAYIIEIRDTAGEIADTDPQAFIRAFISAMTLALWIFRKGSIPNPAAYLAVSGAPIAEAVGDPDFPREALGRFALAYTLLGRGYMEGEWALDLGETATPQDGVVRVRKGAHLSKVFVVRDARALSNLEVAGIVDTRDDEVVVAQAEAIQNPKTRSPGTRYGRTGRTGARQVDLEAVCSSVSTADELFEAFVLEAAL